MVQQLLIKQNCLLIRILNVRNCTLDKYSFLTINKLRVEIICTYFEIDKITTKKIVKTFLKGRTPIHQK